MNTVINLKDLQIHTDFAFHIGEIAETEAAYPHSHDCVNLLFITSGRTLYSINKQIQTAVPGSVFGATGNSVHCFDDNHRPPGYSILFDPSVFGNDLGAISLMSGYNELIVQNFNHRGYSSVVKLEPEPYGKIMTLLHQLKLEYYSKDASIPLLRALLTQLVVELCRCHINRRKKKSETLNLFFEDQTIFNMAISEKMLISQIAESYAISKPQFNRLFRKAFDMSPLEYIHHRKVGNAKKLILENKYSITEIAMRCGFCNSSHMSRVFKKIEGMSPREYKKMYL